MSDELARVLDQVARDKGVDRAILVGALEEAMVAAARKVLHKMGDNLEAQFNDDLGEVEIFEFKDVVDVLGLVDWTVLNEMAEAILAQDVGAALHIVEGHDDGISRGSIRRHRANR